MPDVEADPTTATAYEMGLQYSFAPEYLFDVTAYYRDIENYGRLGFTISPADAGFANYSINTSGGYADSRGLEFGVERPVAEQDQRSRQLRIQLYQGIAQRQ